MTLTSGRSHQADFARHVLHVKAPLLEKLLLSARRQTPDAGLQATHLRVKTLPRSRRRRWAGGDDVDARPATIGMGDTKEATPTVASAAKGESIISEGLGSAYQSWRRAMLRVLMLPLAGWMLDGEDDDFLGRSVERVINQVGRDTCA